MALLVCRFLQVMLGLADILRVGLGLGGFSLVTEEVCDIVLVCSAVDWDQEGGRVVAHLAHVFADRVTLEFAMVWLQEVLQVAAPLGAGWVQPGADGVGSIVQDDGHAVMEEVELLVGVGGDDGVGEQLLGSV